MDSEVFERYRRFIGRPYDAPHGCFRLCQAVYEEEYVDKMPDYDHGLAGDDYNARSAVFLKYMSEDFVQVDDPKEGDIIVINVAGAPWHMGIFIAPGWMLHSFNGADACFERYDNVKYRSRIEGFYRRV